VAARNRAGTYFRNWAEPTNTPTAKQTAQRVTFAGVSNAWKALTTHQRDAWEQWASGLTLLNRQGDSYTPTGRQMFMSVTMNTVIAAGTPAVDPPTTAVAPTIASGITLEVHIDAGGIVSYELHNMGSVTDQIIQFYGAPEQNGGKTNLATLYRYVGVYAYATNASVQAEYITVFGPSGTEGATMKAKLRVIDKISGLSSPWLIVETINQGP
jgi:hypothetical protein